MTEGADAVKWILAVGVLCSAISLAAPWAFAAEVRLAKYDGPWAYGLVVIPPWEEGGKLLINLPEHLSVWPEYMGILHHNDKAPRGHWQVSKDGKTATLDVESSLTANVFVKGPATADSDRVLLSMRIINRTDATLSAITPLYCFHYRHLTGFPQWRGNLKHTFVLIDGKAVALADIPTEKADANVKGAYVQGCPQHDFDRFPRSRGGFIEDRELDAAIIAVEALEGDRKILIAWTPGKSMLSNAAIPCAHGDPFYGPIPPGESGEATGIVLFTEKPVETALKELFKQGHGGPPKEWTK